MNIPSEDHIKFYNLEIKSVFDQWNSYLSKQMRILISEKELFIGRLWSIENNAGLFVIRFKAKEVPRTNTPYFLGLVGIGAVGDPSNWTFTYQEFRESDKSQYWSRKGGDINVINYWKTEGEWAYLIVSIADPILYDYLKTEFIDKDVHPLVVVAQSDPPIRYLLNLKEFVEANKEDDTLNCDVELVQESWKPVGLNNESDITDEIIGLTVQNRITLIQGPAGTGKSFYAAKVCDHYLRNNQPVAVCALTNKALMEIVGQPDLQRSLGKGIVFKTSLSKDESRIQPLLNPIQDFTPKQGELMLTTFYKLSDYYKALLEGSKRFELLIIEEASQAFLATISMFLRLANRVLIIGDHKQLPPVVVSGENKLAKIHPKIKGVINGLETYALNHNNLSYRLIKTRRLTSDAARLTGVFYDNQLASISPLNNHISHSETLSRVFHPNGGVTIAKMPKAGINSVSEEYILQSIVQTAKSLLEDNSENLVSILLPTVNMEKNVIQLFSKLKSDYRRITISTVHKIQGLTCDYTIFYMPLTHAFLELNDNLFNVATSRAKKGCLILTYDHLNLMLGISKEVNAFLKGCTDVTSEFMMISKEPLNQ